jgi:hypothetical protein
MRGNDMPRFYFDVSDGASLTRDEVGLELRDVDQVRTEAVRALPDLARENLPDGDELVFAVHVRDENGQAIFRATLSFRAAWC